MVRMAVGDAYGAEQWRERDGDGRGSRTRTETIHRSDCRAVAEYAFRDRAADRAPACTAGPSAPSAPIYEGMLKEEMDAAAERHPDMPLPAAADRRHATPALVSGAAGAALVIPCAEPRRRRCLSDLVLPLFGSIGGERGLNVSNTQAWHPWDLTISAIQLIVIVSAGVLLTLVALLLKTTTLGKSMRALADNFDLAEVSGINTGRVIAVTWILAGGLAALAGIFAAIYQTALTPDTGFKLLLSIFAAVVLGGIGSAYGALVGGLLIGLVQEWATVGDLIQPDYKEAVGFLVLILVLLIRPQGIFGQARTV